MNFSSGFLYVKKFVDYMCSDRDESHGIDHFERVSNNVKKIIADLGEDKDEFESIPYAEEIVLISAYAHDLWDHKYISETEEIKKKFVKIISKFMNPECCKAIIDIIDNVSYSKEARGETQDLEQYNLLLWIIQGADRIEAIGEIGLKRCFQYNSHIHKLNEESIIDLVVEHCHEKLLKIYGSTKCESAKKFMVDGHRVIIEFIENPKYLY